MQHMTIGLVPHFGGVGTLKGRGWGGGWNDRVSLQHYDR